MSQVTIGMPLYEGCTLLDFVGATEVFRWADGYTVLWLSKDLNPVATTSDARVLPHKRFADALAGETKIDTLFIPGGGDAVAKTMFDTNYIGFLQGIAPRCAWVGSICTGAFLLATAGLLDGCRATTYWSQIENLALFPNLCVESGYPRWVIDEGHHRFTGGGVSSSIDLALELVQRWQGMKQRQITQLGLQYAPDPPSPPSGDPCNAPLSIVTEVFDGQARFIADYRSAVEKIILGQPSL